MARDALLACMVQDALAAAIRERRMVAFRYAGRRRVVEPHTRGLLRGEPRLLAFQTGGESASGPLPEWRLFSVAKIEGFETLPARFGPRPPREGEHVRWERVDAFVPSP